MNYGSDGENSSDSDDARVRRTAPTCTHRSSAGGPRSWGHLVLRKPSGGAVVGSLGKTEDRTRDFAAFAEVRLLIRGSISALPPRGHVVFLDAHFCVWENGIWPFHRGQRAALLFIFAWDPIICGRTVLSLPPARFWLDTACGVVATFIMCVSYESTSARVVRINEEILVIRFICFSCMFVLLLKLLRFYSLSHEEVID